MNDGFGPARPSVAISLVAGIAVVALAGSVSPFAFAFGVLGLGSLIVAFVRGSRLALGCSLGALWVATIDAALSGLPVEGVATALVAAILVWDAGGRALTVGRQLTTAASTGRVEALHASATFAVGLGAFGVAAAVRAVTDGVGAPVAVAALAVGAALLLAVIGDR